MSKERKDYANKGISPNSFSIAVGKIAHFFGTIRGAYAIDRVLTTFGFSDVPPGNKIEKIAFALNRLKADPSAFSGFLTAMLSIHQLSLSKEDIEKLNSYLQSIGYVIKEGHVVPTTIELIREITQKIPFINEEAQRMAEVYTILHILENKLRLFIQEKLSERYGNEWWKKSVPHKIRENCEDRKKKEHDSPWHEVEEAHPLFYTTFKELQRIIQKNWEVFQPYFKDQHAIIGRLSELEIPRNTIAHNRILKKTELDRLKIFSHDIFKCIP
ncbi:MAG: Swt1 family HEPN domain-containing protein [Candidatus Bathyarchaeia archaeon]